MVASYKKLFKLLIDLGLRKKELAELADVAVSTITKMRRDGVTVSSDVLVKICVALDCKFNDIMEIIPTPGELPLKDT